MTGGFTVNPAQLRQAASSISESLDGDRGRALAGASDGTAYGHSRLAAAFAEFVEGTALADEIMTADAESTGVCVREAATIYEARDSEMQELLNNYAEPLGMR